MSGGLAIISAGCSLAFHLDLARSFGQFNRLPRLLRHRVLDESLWLGAQSSVLVLRLVHSDGSVRTIWRQAPSEEDPRREEPEIVLIQHATLTSLDPGLLVPGALPNLWPAAPKQRKPLSHTFSDMSFEFRVRISTEGEAQTPEQKEQCQEITIRSQTDLDNLGYCWTVTTWHAILLSDGFSLLQIKRDAPLGFGADLLICQEIPPSQRHLLERGLQTFTNTHQASLPRRHVYGNRETLTRRYSIH
jgi:hypothetical protein